MKFAAAINDQGRFANTCIGDFRFVPEFGAHIWKGLNGSTPIEMLEQINGAVKSLEELNDPFAKLRVVMIEDGAEAPVEVDENKSTLESENEALRETVRELQNMLAEVTAPRASVSGATLRLLEEAKT
jgi:hypothetical protein